MPDTKVLLKPALSNPYFRNGSPASMHFLPTSFFLSLLGDLRPNRRRVLLSSLSFQLGGLRSVFYVRYSVCHLVFQTTTNLEYCYYTKNWAPLGVGAWCVYYSRGL